MLCNTHVIQMHVSLHRSNNSKRMKDFLVFTSCHGKYGNCLKENFTRHLILVFLINFVFFVSTLLLQIQ